MGGGAVVEALIEDQLDAWITTTSIALGASAYRTLAQTDPSAETAEVFD